MKALRSMVSRAWLLAFVALVALSLTAPARAEPDKAGPTPDQADASATGWLAEGNRAFRAGQFLEAERAYRHAWDFKHGFDIAGDLGMAEVAQNKLREGAEHLAFSLRLFPITGDPAVREQIQKAYAQCLAALGAARVLGLPEGARLYVDGVGHGMAPLLDPVFLDPGEHVFEAKLPGFEGEPVRATIPRGATADVTLALRALPVAPPPSRAPLREAPPAPPIKRRSTLPAILLGGVGAAGIVSGLALFGASSSAHSSGQTLRGQVLSSGGGCLATKADARCGDLRGDLEQSDRLHDAAVGTTLVGVTAAAGAFVYLVWPSRRLTSTGFVLHAEPTVGPGAGGVLASGAF